MQKPAPGVEKERPPRWKRNPGKKNGAEEGLKGGRGKSTAEGSPTEGCTLLDKGRHNEGGDKCRKGSGNSPRGDPAERDLSGEGENHCWTIRGEVDCVWKKVVRGGVLLKPPWINLPRGRKQKEKQS